MPFIKVKTSCPITNEQEIRIKSLMGKAIELVPNKSEEYLLLEFDDHCRLWLGGKNDEPIVYINVAIFGNEEHYGYGAFTTKITHIFAETLGISLDHIYLKFEDIIAWGVHGIYIDRNQYR